MRKLLASEEIAPQLEQSTDICEPDTGTLGQIGHNAFKIKRELIECENPTFGITNEFGKRPLAPAALISPILLPYLTAMSSITTVVTYVTYNQ